MKMWISDACIIPFYNESSIENCRRSGNYRVTVLSPLELLASDAFITLAVKDDEHLRVFVA